MDGNIIAKIVADQALDSAEQSEFASFLELLGTYGNIKGKVESLFGLNPLEVAPRLHSGGIVAGSGADPDVGSDFTGTFLLFPPILLPNGDYANIGGMSAGVIQWCGNSTNGKFYLAAGVIIGDTNGLTVTNDGVFIELNDISGGTGNIGFLEAITNYGVSFVSMDVDGKPTVTNGDFETGDTTGWTLGGSASVTSAQKHAGSYGLNLHGSSGGSAISSSFISIGSSLAGIVSFWAYCSTSASLTASIFCYDAGGVLIGEGTADGVNGQNVSDGVWKHFVIMGTFLDGTTQVKLRFSGGFNPDTVFIDDITFYHGGSGFQLTSNGSWFAGNIKIKGDIQATRGYFDTKVGIGTNVVSSAALNVEGSVIINDSGADKDVRIEGDTDANLIFVDASTDRVGIGTATPAYKLDVAGTINASGNITAPNITPNDGWIAATGTWTPRSQAYTNDPAAGSNIALSMTDTSGFAVGDIVNVSSSAGNENTTITVVTANTSITVNTLGLNHTTTTPLVKLATTNLTFIVDTSADLSASIQVGDRVKFTDTTVKYFIVVAISTTRITMYGGTDYSIAGSAAVTSPFYSHVKNPYGFPRSPSKWKITATNTSNCSKASPTVNTWYGDTGLSATGPNIVLPIGDWKVKYKTIQEASATLVAVAGFGARTSLSTSSSSESDALNTVQTTSTQPIGADLIRATHDINNVLISLAAKTTYYLITLTGQTGLSSIGFRGDVGTTLIEAECAYL